MCVVGILVVGGLVWAMYPKPEKKAVVKKVDAPVVVAAPTKKVVKDNSHVMGSIFDGGVVDRSGANDAIVPLKAGELPVITGNPIEIEVAFGPGKRSISAIVRPKDAVPDDAARPAVPVIDEIESRYKDEWKRLDTMRFSPDRLKALIAYEDFEHDHPGAITSQLHLLRDETLDYLWFDRIEQLWKRRDTAATQIKKFDQEIKDEPNEVFRKTTLLPAKQAEQKKLNAINDLMVTEMGYTTAAPPDLTDDAQLEQLRKLRDRDYFAQWKKRVVNSIHRQRALPWVD